MNSATGPEDLARALADVDRRVEVLRGQVEAAAGGEERRWATREIVALASRFVAADEEVLLPATAEAVGEQGAGARREEQERLEELLAQLARTAPEDDAVVGGAARLAAAVHAHVTALGADLARLDGPRLPASQPATTLRCSALRPARIPPTRRPPGAPARRTPSKAWRTGCGTRCATPSTPRSRRRDVARARRVATTSGWRGRPRRRCLRGPRSSPVCMLLAVELQTGGDEPVA